MRNILRFACVAYATPSADEIKHIGHSLLRNDAVFVDWLHRGGVDPNLVRKPQRPLLYTAARLGKLRLVRFLLAAGADVDKRGSVMPSSAWVTYVQSNAIKVNTKRMNGKRPTSMKSGGAYWNTPLLAAVQNGHVRVVELLLEGGADANIEASNLMGWTPLYLAALHGKKQIARALLTAGAHVNHPMSLLKRKYDSTSPLNVAANCGDYRMVKLLIEAGADVNEARSHTGATAYVASLSLLAPLLTFLQ